MSDSVTLDLPVAADYRSIALDLAKKYVEAAGGSAGDGEAAAGALAPVLDRVARSAPAEATIAVTFGHNDAEVDIHVRCGPETAVVKQPCAFSTR